jgi:hypothetical protein
MYYTQVPGTYPVAYTPSSAVGLDLIGTQQNGYRKVRGATIDKVKFKYLAIREYMDIIGRLQKLEFIRKGVTPSLSS